MNFRVFGTLIAAVGLLCSASDNVVTPAQGNRSAAFFAYEFGYPIQGQIDSDGPQATGFWSVAQDFQDCVNPATPSLRGQHLGEDWNFGLAEDSREPDQPIIAVANGTVIYSKPNYSYGNVVMIRHDLPAGQDFPYVISFYGHLGPRNLVPERDVVTKERTVVTKGAVIGMPGRQGENGFQKNGEPWPVHLHFELRSPSQRDYYVGFGYGGLLPACSTPATTRGHAGSRGWLNPTDASSNELTTSPDYS